MKTSILNPMPWLAACVVTLAATVPSRALTTAEATGLLYMKQEEKMARDVYQALGARWEHAAFARIAVSEQRHMDALDRLITGYGLTDDTPAEAGKFSLPELQKLYDDLVAQGSASLIEALKVGVVIEETDIADLKEAMAASKEAPILRVYGNLLRGSTQHLKAFTALLASGDPTAAVGAGRAECARNGACGAGAGAGAGAGRGQGACDRICDGSQAGCVGDGSCPMGSSAPGQGGGRGRGATAGQGAGKSSGSAGGRR